MSDPSENELDREDSNREWARLGRARDESNKRNNGSACHSSFVSRFQLIACSQIHTYKSIAR
jgi:hypothetical protein